MQHILSCSTSQCTLQVGEGLLSDSLLLKAHVANTQVLIVTNETVAPLYLARVQHALTSFQCDSLILPDGEAYKTAAELALIYDELLLKQHHRDTTLIALGGGVLCDLTGFAAATYLRGVKVVYIPTTLLAQVDAAIGGKTAINHPVGKNVIGCFYQPHGVIADVETLRTLPRREFRSGLAEVIKYALLTGGEWYEKLPVVLDPDVLNWSSQDLADLVLKCALLKHTFVEQDEKDQGRRQLLNLGHTFGHALETITHYQRWLHGEAVAIGLYCAAQLSYLLGHLTAASVDQIDALLALAGLPRRIPKDIDVAHLQVLMGFDKKIKNQQQHFVLVKATGDCYLDNTVTIACVAQALHNAMKGEEHECSSGRKAPHVSGVR